MIVKIKRLTDTAIIPQYQTKGAAAIDLHADLPDQEYQVIGAKSTLIPTGLSISIPIGYVGVITTRSGLGHKRGLVVGNGVGIIDSDYRGQIMVSLYNNYYGGGALYSLKERIEHGDRIAQMLFIPVMQAILDEVDELDKTERGESGFGSTGK